MTVEQGLNQQLNDTDTVEAVIAGLKANFTYTEKRRIVFALLEDLSPQLTADEAAPLPIDEPSVVPYPRSRPGFGS